MPDTTTLYDQTFEAAKRERDRRSKGKNLISLDECPTELNRMGLMHWYLHPGLDAPSTRALYFHELEIQQGSNSGKLSTSAFVSVAQPCASKAASVSAASEPGAATV